MKFDIRTFTTLDEKIIQEVTREDFQDIKVTMMRQIMDTKEEQLRNALISLGWTPPKEDKI